MIGMEGKIGGFGKGFNLRIGAGPVILARPMINSDRINVVSYFKMWKKVESLTRITDLPFTNATLFSSFSILFHDFILRAVP